MAKILNIAAALVVSTAVSAVSLPTYAATGTGKTQQSTGTETFDVSGLDASNIESKLKSYIASGHNYGKADKIFAEILSQKPELAIKAYDTISGIIPAGKRYDSVRSALSGYSTQVFVLRLQAASATERESMIRAYVKNNPGKADALVSALQTTFPNDVKTYFAYIISSLSESDSNSTIVESLSTKYSSLAPKTTAQNDGNIEPAAGPNNNNNNNNNRGNVFGTVQQQQPGQNNNNNPGENPGQLNQNTGSPLTPNL